jgi:hypothetical protein
MAGTAMNLKDQESTTLTLEERIRARAHEIYLERNGQDGSELDDWLQAEAEIRGAGSQAV